MPASLSKMTGPLEGKVFIVVDTSYSMSGTYGLWSGFKEVLLLAEEKGAIIEAFHHKNRKIVLVESLMDDMGATNLAFAFDNFTCAVLSAKSGEVTLVFFTDGMHNATPPREFFEKLFSFYNVVMTSGKKIVIHVVSAGPCYDQTLVNEVLPAIVWLCQHMDGHGNPSRDGNTRVLLTHTTLQAFVESKGEFGEPQIISDQKAMLGLKCFLEYLPDKEKRGVSDGVNGYLAQVPNVKPPVPNSYTLLELVEAFVTGRNATLGRRDMLEKLFTQGVMSGESGVGEILKQLCADPEMNELFSSHVFDGDMNIALDAMRSGNFSQLASLWLSVMVMDGDGAVTIETIADAMTLLRETSPMGLLVFERQKFPEKHKVLLGALINSVQSYLVPGSATPVYKDVFLYNVLFLENTDLLKSVLKTMVQCTRGDYMFTNATNYLDAVDEMINDIKVKQGDEQTFTGTVNCDDMRKYLWVLFGCAMYPEETFFEDVLSRRDLALDKMAILGMITRFSLDSNNFPVDLLMRSDVDPAKIGDLIMFLQKNKETKKHNVSREDLARCYHACTENERRLGEAKKVTKNTIDGICKPKIFVAPSPEGPLSDYDLATLFWLSGITDFISLAKFITSVLAICKRKTKENDGDKDVIYKIIGLAIKFLPNEAMNTLVNSDLLDHLVGSGWRDSRGGPEFLELSSSGIYAKTMGLLAGIPPPQGWGSMDPEKFGNRFHEFLTYIGENKEMIPLTLVKSGPKIAGLLEAAEKMRQTYKTIHEKCIYHTHIPTDILKNQHICKCGMPFVVPEKPSCAKVDKKMTKIVIPAPPSTTRHIGAWMFFGRAFRDARTLEDHVAAIKLSLTTTDTSKPDRKVIKWAKDNGGLDAWLEKDIRQLLDDRATARIIKQLMGFC